LDREGNILSSMTFQMTIRDHSRLHGRPPARREQRHANPGPLIVNGSGGA
jgi:hypothetical protein